MRCPYSVEFAINPYWDGDGYLCLKQNVIGSTDFLHADIIYTSGIKSSVFSVAHFRYTVSCPRNRCPNICTFFKQILHVFPSIFVVPKVNHDSKILRLSRSRADYILYTCTMEIQQKERHDNEQWQHIKSIDVFLKYNIWKTKPANLNET